MYTRLTICAIPMVVLSGCVSGNEPGAAELPADKGPDPFGIERQYSFKEVDPDRLPAGEWQFRNGMKLCKGYLTRIEDEDFCAESIPEGWKAFEFNGRTYYRVPLAGTGMRGH